MKKVLVPVAHSTEELEAVTIIDVLRRADIDVCVASVMPDEKTVRCAHQTFIEADADINDVIEQPWDMIVLPGGMPGAKYLQECAPLVARLKQQKHNTNWIAAICASPAVVLAHHGLLAGHKACCYPGFDDELAADGELTQNGVEVASAGMLITARGPANALEFALTIVRELLGEERAQQVASGLLASDVI